VETPHHSPILNRRQLSKFLAKDHQVKKPFNADTRAAELFADDGACMFSPLVSEGPLCENYSFAMSTLCIADSIFAHIDVSGEQVRRNLTENERGVPMTFEVQVVNSKTCEPLKDVAVDIWSCNTTVRFASPLPFTGI